ncbi:MAG: DUF3052 domain-containing protein [Flavobacteriaceae bacterium]|nr:MAG: DUF3052 domain-containing protein [Flavobacteriaceae bacterium]
MASSGYSGTPLARKLGIKDGHTVLLVGQPRYYFDLFLDLPEIQLVETPAALSVDFIHLFSTSIADFQERSIQLKPFLKYNGMLWVSWPKNGSKIESELSGNFVREYLLANGLVDVKVCAVDKDWSALKFVYRLKDRK